MISLLFCASAFAAQPTPTPTFTEWQSGFVAAMKTAEAIEERAFKKMDRDLDADATKIAKEYGMGWPKGQWIVTATPTATPTPIRTLTATYTWAPNIPNAERTCVVIGHQWGAKFTKPTKFDSLPYTCILGLSDAERSRRNMTYTWFNPFGHQCRRCGLWREMPE